MSKKQLLEQSLAREIVTYGAPILKSPIFLRGRTQTHHKISTVAEHTLNVAIASAKLSSFLERRHIKVDRQDVITGALLHDLGIIGREEKFKNNHECGQKHPIDSARTAKELLPDLNANVENIITSHMFPVTPHPPKSREGVIVLLADKYCATAEWVCHIAKKEYYAKIKRAIADALAEG